MAFNVEKILHICLSRKKNSIVSPEAWQKKILTQTKSAILPRPKPPPPLKSQMVGPYTNNPNETSHIPKQQLH